MASDGNTSGENPNFTTIGDIVNFLIGPTDESKKYSLLLEWPPDAFAVSMRLLQNSGAYLLAAHDWPFEQPAIAQGSGGRGAKQNVQWEKWVREIAIDWLKTYQKDPDNGILGSFNIRKNRKQLSPLKQMTDELYLFNTWRLSRLYRPLLESLSGSDDEYGIIESYFPSIKSEESGNASFVRDTFLMVREFFKPEKNLKLLRDETVAFQQTAGNDERALHGDDFETAKKAMIRFSSALSKHARATDIGAGWKNLFKNLRNPKVDSHFLCIKTLRLFEWAVGFYLTRILLTLAAIADEACQDLGLNIPEAQKNNGEAGDQSRLNFYWDVEEWLFARSQEELPSTLCKNIRSKRGMVVPKFNTPKSGMTIRSLSHNLALLRPGEVHPLLTCDTARSQMAGETDFNLSLLLVPWPDRVLPVNFEPVPEDAQFPTSFRRPNLRHFEYRPQIFTVDHFHRLTRMMAACREQCGSIDGIVFPEMAIDVSQDYELMHEIIAPHSDDRPRFVIRGLVNGTSGGFSENLARLTLIKDYQFVWAMDEVDQHKHHRWVLSRSQVAQYGLGRMLDMNHEWEENTLIPRRRINFIRLAQGITIAVLICEDLAQSDPIGDVIRAVGPHLLICLLADGPQIASRWAARYALGFADDPGCSVLTFTSLGMANLSQPINGEKRRDRAIALWRSPKDGTREVELPVDASGTLLSLSILNDPGQYDAFGRSRRESTIFNSGGKTLALSGIHHVRI
ncbi:hypothetical protein [Blastopirellula retiformator]|uniref:Uncharacterized protein n=1 Tax=Blastopirellula retiformator TaxID=2527970 RepID=A0A5C5VKL0_9BACT|nr:hypothetical protein [Blastopirellula retiformator]TWT38571.1 hypothetical protein Enr8_02640 [Blastopirellula retiformator]